MIGLGSRVALELSRNSPPGHTHTRNGKSTPGTEKYKYRDIKMVRNM